MEQDGNERKDPKNDILSAFHAGFVPYLYMGVASQ
jgi:hypothetical protein